MAFTYGNLTVDAGDVVSSDTTSQRTVITDDVIGGTVRSIVEKSPVFASLYAPGDFCVDFDDFSDYSTSNYAEFLQSGTIALSTSLPNGVIAITSDTAATETSTQKKNCWNLHASKYIYHETRFMVPSATGGAVCVGIGDEITTPIADGPASGLYMVKPAGSATVNLFTPIDGYHGWGSTPNPVIVDNTYHTFSVIATRTDAIVYFDGQSVFSKSSGSSASVLDLRWMTSTLGAVGTATVLYVDYHITIQAR